VHITISSVPKADTDTFINFVGRGDSTVFFSHLLRFGEEVIRELRSGSLFAAGTNFLGYHAIDITLTGRIRPITNVGWSKEVRLPDVPDTQRLRTLMRQTGQNDSDLLLGRFMYWFSIAAQIWWMEHSVFVMNAREKRWEHFHFKPLRDMRQQFSY
jgi:hypothetical protein